MKENNVIPFYFIQHFGHQTFINDNSIYRNHILVFIYLQTSIINKMVNVSCMDVFFGATILLIFCMCVFDVQILIAPLVSSNSSYMSNSLYEITLLNYNIGWISNKTKYACHMYVMR